MAVSHCSLLRSFAGVRRDHSDRARSLGGRCITHRMRSLRDCACSHFSGDAGYGSPGSETDDGARRRSANCVCTPILQLFALHQTPACRDCFFLKRFQQAFITKTRGLVHALVFQTFRLCFFSISAAITGSAFARPDCGRHDYWIGHGWCGRGDTGRHSHHRKPGQRAQKKCQNGRWRCGTNLPICRSTPITWW